MLIIFQILFCLFVLFAVLSVMKKKQEGLLGPKGLIFWFSFWILATILVFYPNSTTTIAHYLGIGRGTDLLLYISLVVIFYVLFRLHIKLESIGRSLTKIVRKDALEEAKKDKK